MALISAIAAQEHWPGPTPRSSPYFNYRLEHVQQVERESMHLQKEPEGQAADTNVILAMVWIHDRFKPQYEGFDHAARAGAWTREHLAGLGFPADQVEIVAYGVEHHTDLPGTIPENRIEARLLWDADKLTRLGALNIVNRLVANPAYPEQRVTYTNMALLGLERLEKSRRLVNQFYFECSRQWAKERFALQKTFYEMLARDVEA